ncbi:MAG TPA: SAM-dependent methyltransferase [Polyangiales bacterium]|nr:SAM-dependent methyltransferase [Polyangiales bacterium]
MKHSGKQVEASLTAQWVAAARTVGALLPSELVLARDPFGVEFARGGMRKFANLLLSQPLLARTLLPHAGPLTGFLLWMQLRTRALDDVLLAFVRGGGRQVVLLGAGYDCRALRFAAELAGCTVYEVDHPATQQVKTRSLPVESFHNRVVYVPFDFERDALAELPARLHAEGLQQDAPVLTIWEGVTMYLSEAAIDATLGAIKGLASDSRLAMTYIDRRVLERRPTEVALSARIVARVGEPWRFGWHPAELPRWLAARGFRVTSDESDSDLAARLLPPRAQRYFVKGTRHLALARLQAPV